MLALIAVLAFVTLLLVGWAAVVALRAREERRDALVRRLNAFVGPTKTTTEGPILRDQRISQIGPLDTLLGRLPVTGPALRLIRQAGVRRRASEVLLYVPLLGFGAFVVTVLADGGELFGLVVGVACAGLPIVVLRRMRSRRAFLFAEQLPDALDMTRAALQAGHGIASAFAIVAEEFPDPIAAEFRDLTQEIRLGLPMREALGNLCARVDNPDLPILMVGVLIAQEAGGNLGEVITNIGYTIRERFKMQRETQVLTAQGRLSGSVLTCLPLCLAAALYFFAPEYFRPMTQSPKGQMVLAYALGSILCGHLTIRRLTRIKA